MPSTEWTDDPTISDDELLWRRVLPRDIKSDHTGDKKPKSAVFLSRKNQLSVDIASMTNTANALAEYPELSLAEFTVGLVRSFGCMVVRDPLQDNPAHALVIGGKRDGSLTKAQAKNIANNSRIRETPG